MNQLVSIIIPVYNAEKFIEKTIDSVRRQTYTNWELLLVEDSSTDHTLEVMTRLVEELKDDRIIITRQDGDNGAAGARNKGLELAKGRFITFLDADDLWVPDKLEKELHFLEEQQKKDPEAGFVFSGYEFADENAVGTGKVVRVPRTLNLKQALGNTTIFTSTVLLDTEKIDKDLMRMPYIKSEDTATWWQILKTGKLAYGLDENLVLYRRAGKSLSSNKIEALRRIWNLYRKAAGLSVPASCYYFVLWAVRAVKRRT